MPQPQFRQMTDEERAIVAKLLEKQFDGRRELSKQVTQAMVREIAGAGDHWGSIEFKVANLPEASTTASVPTEARGYDEDGIEVDFLLHVRDGRLDTLEVVKADGSSIRRLPRAKMLTVGHQN